MHAHTFNGPLSGTTQVSRYQKGKTNQDFTEARDSEWQWHQLGHMQICTSLQTNNHASTPSVPWLCWLGGRKGIRPVKKTEWWGAGMVICLERGADLYMAQWMPLPLTVSCVSKIQIGFTFLVLAYPGSPGQRAVKRVYVYVPHHSIFTGRMLFLPPNQQHQSTEGKNY